jgi:hypothetical protein
MPAPSLKLHLLYADEPTARKAADELPELPKGATWAHPPVAATYETAALWEVYAHGRFADEASRDTYVGGLKEVVSGDSRVKADSSVLRWLNYDDEPNKGDVSRASIVTEKVGR